MLKQKGNTTLLILVLLLAGAAVGFFAASKWIKAPNKQVTISQIVPKKDLILVSKDILSLYNVCPGTREYLILWGATVNYKLDLNATDLQFQWTGNNLHVSAPAITMDDKIAVTPNSKKSWKLNGALVVNDTAAMEKEKNKSEALALSYGYKALLDGEIEPTFRTQFIDMIENIALGMGRKVDNITVSFAKPEAKIYDEPEVAYCKEDKLISYFL